MSKAKTKYENLCDQISAAVTANRTSSYSHGDLVAMSHALINSPELEKTIIVKDPESNGPKEITLRPSKEYRDSLKGVVKKMGVDINELGKLDEMEFSKDHAEAICGLATTLVNDYTRTGRKFIFPMTSKDQSQMSITQEKVGEKKVAGRKIEKDETTGKYTSTETGAIITTKPHVVMSASNPVPGWLKSSTDDKKKK